MKAYQEILIWKSIDRTSSLRYVCFQDLFTKKYCIQSADFFQIPIDAKQLQQFQKQAVELFTESSPTERCEWFDSVIEAINDHDIVFGN